MNEFVYKLALDLNCAKTPPVICSGQFDKGRKFEFTITANGESFDVTGCSAVLKGVRTDGSHFAVECNVSDGKIIKTLDDTTLSVRGKTVAKLVISDSEKSYSTQMFIIDVDSALDGDITVADDYSILNRLIEQIHALNESGAILIDDTIDKDSDNAVANSAVAKALVGKADSANQAVTPEKENGYFVVLTGNWTKNAIVNIKLNDGSGIVDGDVQLQVFYSSDTYTKIATVKANEVVNYILTADTEKIRCYIPQSAVNSDGAVSFVVEQIGIMENVANIKKQAIENKELILNVKSDINDLKSVINPQVTSVNQAVTPEKENGYFVVLTGNWTKNAIVNIKLNDGSGIVNGDVQLQVFYSSDTYTKIATVKANEIVNYTFTVDTEKIRCYIPQSAIVSSGTVSLIVEQLGVVEKISEIKESIANLSNNLSGKTFSVIGDSYSAYKSWIPYENGYWYTNADYDTQITDRVDSVTQMWWYILSQKTKMSLICNESMSGTTISTTGYDGKDYTLISFTTRAKKTLGENNVTSPKPDIIFIFGGTNDDWAIAPVGEIKYSDWTTDDLKSVLPAFCCLIDYLKLYNPHATIVNIVNEGMDTDIATGMATACEYYNVTNVTLSGINKEAGHPTATGQAAIAEQLISTLKSI